MPRHYLTPWANLKWKLRTEFKVVVLLKLFFDPVQSNTTSVTNNSIPHSFPLHFCRGAMTDPTNLAYFPRMWCRLVSSHVTTNLAPDCCQVGRTAVCMWSQHPAAFASYHTSGVIVQDEFLHAPFTGRLLIRRESGHFHCCVRRCKASKSMITAFWIYRKQALWIQLKWPHCLPLSSEAAKATWG